jgi:hypothetical protein
MRQIFDVMFVLCLFLPPAAVFVGAVALAWPRRGHEVPMPTAHPAHA